MSEGLRLTGIIPAGNSGERTDRALAKVFPEYSRARLQQWIRLGYVKIDGLQPRVRDPVCGGEQVIIDARITPQTGFEAQSIPLNVVYEDDHLLVIDKPAGLVAHPAAGNWGGTLLNALLHHAPRLENVPRAGIVHRLDKDTSGLMVVAKSLTAHKQLVDQLKARTVKREYLTVVGGRLIAGGMVKKAIGRHPVDRKRMAVTDTGKPARTHYRIDTRYRAHTLLRVRLDTGRTHQIRVHMAHIRHPVTGDPVYGGRLMLPAGANASLIAALRAFKRQALHAARLELAHPDSGATVNWTAPVPGDMQALIDALRADADPHD
ncbi:MAG: 23S rRNA pseudouridine(1911/1915/1917) synthase RluD [Gammaproteobacteria bacterium]|nr:23S rRNA pseudouridine(1911/1915/1917) synthase RluD [Gammaproteobacteria bacterium]